MKLNQLTPAIWTISHFLSPQECDELIYMSELSGYEEAKVSFTSGAKIMKGLRNNERILFKDEVLAQKLWAKLETFCPTHLDNSQAIGLNEQFRFYKYEGGQRFKKHIDGRFKRNELEESRITFMVYLNDQYEGGKTSFDEISISPQQGLALCFIHELKHEGSPVTSGIKYVLRSDVMYRKIQEK
ncbi:MAG: 2OG-Fe(II) oxygenase [Flammeovirgaceae bacterium]